jgi:hypothetical protein
MMGFWRTWACRNAAMPPPAGAAFPEFVAKKAVVLPNLFRIETLHRTGAADPVEADQAEGEASKSAWFEGGREC